MASPEKCLEQLRGELREWHALFDTLAADHPGRDLVADGVSEASVRYRRALEQVHARNARVPSRCRLSPMRSPARQAPRARGRRSRRAASRRARAPSAADGDGPSSHTHIQCPQAGAGGRGATPTASGTSRQSCRGASVLRRPSAPACVRSDHGSWRGRRAVRSSRVASATARAPRTALVERGRR